MVEELPMIAQTAQMIVLVAYNYDARRIILCITGNK